MMIKNQKILITGWSGFIGSKTVEKLVELGYKVIPFKGDVRSIRSWVDNLENIDIVLHIAGVKTETEKDFEVNTKGVENLFLAIESSRKVPGKIILASSQAVYSGLKPPFKENMNLSPKTVYGESKFKAEKIATEKAKKLGISLVILRYSIVLGAGVREKSTMSRPLVLWAEEGIKGLPILVFQDGNQTRDYIHIDDVVCANILAIERIESGIFNVGGGKEIKLKDLAEIVKSATGGKSEILVVSGKPTVADPRQLISDIKKLKSFGWKPEKSIKEAVEKYVASLHQTQRD